MRLDLRDGEAEIQGELSFSCVRPWPVTSLSPGAMGWYGLVPFMECCHGVLSFDHGIRGSLSVNGGRADLTGGKGYCEKDWGASMPACWIWMQTNRFDTHTGARLGEIRVTDKCISVLLRSRSTGRAVFSGSGRNAGLEFVGNVDEMVRGLRGFTRGTGNGQVRACPRCPLRSNRRA